MKDFNLKSYHYRSINASTDEAKAAINQALKNLYASLNEEDQKDFNQQLKTYLVKTVKQIGADYEAIKNN